MLRVLADNADLTLPLDDLALLAHRLNRRSYFHDVPPFHALLFKGCGQSIFEHLKNVRLIVYRAF